MRRDATSVGGVRLVEPRRIQPAHQRLQTVIKLFRRISLIARAPDRNGWMVAVANNLVGDVGNVGRNVRDVWTIKRVWLEKLIPQQDSILVRHIVEVRTRALSHPVE